MRRFILFALVFCAPPSFAAEKISKNVTFHPGPVNGVEIRNQAKVMAVYGLPKSVKKSCDLVLLTHHRRDVVWAAEDLIKQGSTVAAPHAELALIQKPNEFWQSFVTRRFHDYAQQSTKILARGLRPGITVRNQGVVGWNGRIKFEVLETPGYTRGAVTYIATIDGQKMAFSGDLIYGDGQLFDLYSLQDAIPSAQVRGYHGYGGRLGQLVTSLQKLDKANPKLILPARGPVIRNPRKAIRQLIRRVRAVYANYLSTNALNWYFKEKRLTICGKRVLGKDAKVKLKSYSLYQKTPDWIWEKGTSRLLISEKRRGFLLDCGNGRILESVKKLIAQGLIEKVDGIFVTHYHDDHADAVQKAAETFKCPVYATTEYKDILENPSGYHMPAMTANPIKNIRGLKHGHKMKWHEFDLTFHYFPGQAYYHGAMLVEKKGAQPVYFIGDAFSPSGLDDYCVLNRNLIHEDSGYFDCLNKVKQAGKVWLINEHIPYVFSFTDKELGYFRTQYLRRKKMLAELFPWDDPNYGIDEQWAVFYPYGQTAKQGATVSVEVRITNHSPKKRTFKVTPKAPVGCAFLDYKASITLEARKSGRLRFSMRGPKKKGTYLVTADVDSDGMQFRDWIEAMVIVK